MSEPACGECGNEDGDRYMECCGINMCDDCADRHEAKWNHEADEPIPYRITPAGREHLDGKA